MPDETQLIEVQKLIQETRTIGVQTSQSRRSELPLVPLATPAIAAIQSTFSSTLIRRIVSRTLPLHTLQIG